VSGNVEHYERLRASGDPREVHRASDMPDEHVKLFSAEIDRLPVESVTAISPEFVPGQIMIDPYLMEPAG